MSVDLWLRSSPSRLELSWLKRFVPKIMLLSVSYFFSDDAGFREANRLEKEMNVRIFRHGSKVSLPLSLSLPLLYLRLMVRSQKPSAEFEQVLRNDLLRNGIPHSPVSLCPLFSQPLAPCLQVSV
jgi:hypothetical protein